MSLLSGFLKGLEYKKAIESAVDAYENGRSLPEIIRSFSIETEGTLDDRWAHDVEEILRTLIDRSQSVATVVGRVASSLETKVPIIFDRIFQFENRLNTEYMPVFNEYGDKLESLCYTIGVLALKVKTRAEGLNRDGTRIKAH